MKKSLSKGLKSLLAVLLVGAALSIQVKADEAVAASPNPPGSWDIIISGQNFIGRSYTVSGKKNVLIKDSTFKDMANVYQALKIENSDNVYILNSRFEQIHGSSGHVSALRIENSTNVVVDGITITEQRAPDQHSHGIFINGSASSNIIIKNSHIYNTDGNGISTGGTSDESLTIHDMPIPNVKVQNNLIHDVAQSKDMAGNSPKHGMYVKAVDALIENNTVYNVADGSCLSVRSTAIVRGNKAYNCRGGVFHYWPQKPAGPTQKLIIENNLFYQTKIMGDQSDIRVLGINFASNNTKRFDDFSIRFNTVVLDHIATSASSPVVFISEQFNQVKLYGNMIVDRRTASYAPKYVSHYYSSTNAAKLISNYKNYTANNFNAFKDAANGNYDVWANSGADNYAVGISSFPAVALDGVTRSSTSLDAGAYAAD